MFKVKRFPYLCILGIMLQSFGWCFSASTYVQSSILYPSESNEIDSDSDLGRRWSAGVPYLLFKSMITTIMNQSRYIPSKAFGIQYNSNTEIMEKESSASSFGPSIVLFQKIRDFFVAAKDSLLEDINTSQNAGDSRGVKGLKVKKKFKKFLLPLLIAYKLKFLTLVPVFIASLVLLVGSTGLAGFFFALFASVMSLKSDTKH